MDVELCTVNYHTDSLLNLNIKLFSKLNNNLTIHISQNTNYKYTAVPQSIFIAEYTNT